MPLDASIPLQVQRFKAPDKSAQLAQLLQLKQAQTQNALADYQMQKGMEADQRATQYRNALQTSVGPDGKVNYDTLKSLAIKNGDIGTAMDIDKNIASTNALEADKRLKNLQEAKERIDVTSRLLAGVNDEPTHQAFRQKMAATFGASALAGIPETYDPNWQKSELAGAMSYKDHVDAEQAKLTAGETARHNKRMEGLQERKLEQSGPLALITSPDGTTTAVGGPNGISPNASAALGTARGQVKQGEEFGKATGKYFGQKYSDILQAGDDALVDNSKLARLDSLLTDVDTGKFKGTTLEIKKAAKAAGVDLESLGIRDDVAPTEAARALSGELTLNAVKAAKLTPVSNTDLAYMQSLQPGIENTPEGRKFIVATRKALNQRAIEVSKKAVAYKKANGSIDEGFQQEMTDYAEKNPLFHVVASDADFNSVPSGSFFAAPDGTIRRKP